MDDLMNKLQAVLNDEESMNQIKEIAGMLSSADGQEEGSAAAATQGQPPDLSALLNGLTAQNGGGNRSVPAPSAQGLGIDPNKLLQLGQVLGKANRNDKNIDFLLALKPLLKEENREKIDRVIKLFRIMAIYPDIKEVLGGDIFGLLG